MPQERLVLGVLSLAAFTFADFEAAEALVVLLAADFTGALSSLAVIRVTLDVLWFLATPSFLPI